MWRCWVCNRCQIVSYHHITWCPTCGRPMDKIVAPSKELQERFPEGPGKYTPYEWDPRFVQPWSKGEEAPRNPFVFVVGDRVYDTQEGKVGVVREMETYTHRDGSTTDFYVVQFDDGESTRRAVGSPYLRPE